LLGRADQARHDSWRRLVQDRHPDLRRVALWWRDWLPLHAMLFVANTHDSRLFEPLL
jgi:hypothetical protein